MIIDVIVQMIGIGALVAKMWISIYRTWACRPPVPDGRHVVVLFILWLFSSFKIIQYQLLITLPLQ